MTKLGIPGVIYILRNRGLREGMYKIGFSKYSGSKRAKQLNQKAVTGMPAEYECIFECKTKDSRIAEKCVFEKLKEYRRGKKGQEFFEVSFEQAKRTIVEVCDSIERKFYTRQNFEQHIRTTTPFVDRASSVLTSLDCFASLLRN